MRAAALPHHCHRHHCCCRAAATGSCQSAAGSRQSRRRRCCCCCHHRRCWCWCQRQRCPHCCCLCLHRLWRCCCCLHAAAAPAACHCARPEVATQHTARSWVGGVLKSSNAWDQHASWHSQAARTSSSSLGWGDAEKCAAPSQLQLQFSGRPAVGGGSMNGCCCAQQLGQALGACGTCSARHATKTEPQQQQQQSSKPSHRITPHLQGCSRAVAGSIADR